jgi:hypothetical protein
MMDSGGKIMMDGGSGDEQWRRNGWWDGKVFVIGNGTVVVQWMAQWMAGNHHQFRSGSMGGNARWMAVAITMDGGGAIAIDGGNGDGQRQCNGQWDSKLIAMGNGMVAEQCMAQLAADNCTQCRSRAIGGNAR